jgi:uncharacterized membrane protein YagU involved in acid resistance
LIDPAAAGTAARATTAWRAVAARAAATGAVAGLTGGIVSGIALLQIGTLPSTVSLVRYGAPFIGFSLYLAGAVVLGAGFGVLVSQQRSGAGETLYWGLLYGATWWFLGPLTLLPILQLGIVTWDVHSIQEAFASFIAHLVFGAVTGLALAALRRLQRTADIRPTWASIRTVAAQGGLAGIIGGWLLAALIGGRPAVGPVWWIGLAGGVCYVALYPRPFESTGPSLIRGLAYGFIWWILWPLTLLPFSRGAGLAWSVEAARAAFSLLPGYIIYGSAVAVASLWLKGLARALFSDGRGGNDEEGAGTEGLRAVGRGVLAGLAGGVIYALILLRLGALPAVAGLIGFGSAGAGLIVHLAIASVIGAGYGLLFKRQSFDAGSALGWGVSYGFLWWILGPLTLMPRLTGGPGQWSPEAAAALFGSLIGHFAYGAAAGIVFHLLEARYSPWWIPWTLAEEARVARRKEQVLTSAPALWALVVLIALVLPIVLSV